MRALHLDPLGDIPGVKQDLEGDTDIRNSLTDESSLILHAFSMTSLGLLGYAPSKNEKG